MMEDVADASCIAGKPAIRLAGPVFALIGDKHDHRRSRPIGGLRMINSRVSCLDGPEQHREHHREEAADQTVDFRVPIVGRPTRILLRVDEQIGELLCMKIQYNSII